MLKYLRTKVGGLKRHVLLLSLLCSNLLVNFTGLSGIDAVPRYGKSEAPRYEKTAVSQLDKTAVPLHEEMAVPRQEKLAVPQYDNKEISRNDGTTASSFNIETTRSDIRTNHRKVIGSITKPDPRQEYSSFFQRALVESEQGILDEIQGASVYQIDLHISPDLFTLKGYEEIQYTNQEDVPLDEIYFNLSPNITGGRSTVSDAMVNGQEVETAYMHQDSVLKLSLPELLLPGDEVTISMDFEVAVAQEMGWNHSLFGYFNDVLVLDSFYPVIPVYNEEGWNVRESLPRNGEPKFNDVSLFLVRVTAPAELVVAASGVEIEREEVGGEQMLTFATGPARDFFLAASEKYITVSEKVGEVTINVYAHLDYAVDYINGIQGTEQLARIALRTAKNALLVYNEHFGPYPYTEFDILSTPMEHISGIEYPGIVGISLDIFRFGYTQGTPNYILMELIIAHEVGHQWFYNVVGNDQFNEPWLDESITQYIVSLYYGDDNVNGEIAPVQYRDYLEYLWSIVDMEEIPIGLSSDDYTKDYYSAIIYGRGSLFLETLSEEMEEETFDVFLRDYYQKNKWGIATTESFRELSEEHCECDLTAMFEQWVYGSGTETVQEKGAPGGISLPDTSTNISQLMTTIQIVGNMTT